jgi:hypothetical protein
MTMFVQPLQNLNENKADQKVNEKRTFVNPVFDGADLWFIKKEPERGMAERYPPSAFQMEQ